MNEGLIVSDDCVEITTISVSDHVGIVFDLYEEEENEKSNVA